MIKRKDVILLLVPYPDQFSELCRKKHMYICQQRFSDRDCFVKCGSLKPFMVASSDCFDEYPDRARNPFDKCTRIFCDKIFEIRDVAYDPIIRTQNRPDVCDELILKIDSTLKQHCSDCVVIDTSVLFDYNSGIKPKNTKTVVRIQKK